MRSVALHDRARQRHGLQREQWAAEAHARATATERQLQTLEHQAKRLGGDELTQKVAALRDEIRERMAKATRLSAQADRLRDEARREMEAVRFLERRAKNLPVRMMRGLEE